MVRKSKSVVDSQHISTYLDFGVMDFMKWMAALEEGDTNNNPCIIKEIVADKHIIFYDKHLMKDILVVFKDCVPWCNNCKVDDCGHIGFAICLRQYYIRSGSTTV